MKMISLLAIAAALTAAAPAAHASTTPRESQEARQAKPTMSPFAAHLQAGENRFNSGDYAGARTEYAEAVADPDFSAMPQATRHLALTFLASAESMSGDDVAAYAHLTAAGPATGDVTDTVYYYTMTVAGYDTGHKDEALDALIGLGRVAPDKLKYFTIRFIGEMDRLAHKRADGGITRKQLLETLWSAHYESTDIYDSMETLWFDLFEIHVAAGEDDAARAILPAFQDPRTVIKLRCDKRYSRFLTTYPRAGNFAVSLDASIAAARALMAAHPRDIAAVDELVSRLSDANHLDEALKLTDGVLAKVAAAPKDAPAYDDQGEKLPWLQMTRADVLQRLGRVDDQLKSQEAARDNAASSRDTVSQAINLGDQYYATGRPQDALDAVKDVDGNVSPYGQMAAMEVRACAYKALADTDKLATTMAYMKAHVDDGYGPYRGALLCTGDTEGMADVLVARLDNPETRNEVLVWVQNYLPQPMSDFARQLSDVAETAQARPEVKAAIAKYGTVETYAIFEW